MNIAPNKGRERGEIGGADGLANCEVMQVDSASLGKMRKCEGFWYSYIDLVDAYLPNRSPDVRRLCDVVALINWRISTIRL